MDKSTNKSNGTPYLLCSDESGFPAKKYQAISAISGPLSEMNKLRKEIRSILKRSNIKELKWNKLNSKIKIDAFKDSIRRAIEKVSQTQILISVLIWNLDDPRHKIKNRDDYENFNRMFWHLMKNICQKHNHCNYWNVYVDQNDAIYWEKTFSVLNNTNINNHENKSKQKIIIKNHKQKESHKEPLIQLADLFAGIAVFSNEKRNEFKFWETEKTNQIGSLIQEKPKISNRDLKRFELVEWLMNELQASLNLNFKDRYLKTYPDANINFWHYTPQHNKDRAPIKNKKSKK